MFKFALKNMMIKKVKIILIVLSVVISASVAILAYNISQQVDDGLKTTTAKYTMIIGPAGSSTQLAMNTMFFTDKPVGTIPYEVYEDIKNDPDVAVAIPFTMGDSYNSAKIVGTTNEFLNDKSVDEGRMFENGVAFEAVVGAEVAEKYGISIGDKLVTSHGIGEGGHSHGDSSSLTVVGILDKTNTNYDNVIFTPVETVWHTHSNSDEEHSEEDEHEHEHGEICAVLVNLSNMGKFTYIQNKYQNADYINEDGDEISLSAISTSEVMRDILENVDMSSHIVLILCVIILLMNIFIISIITLLNMYDSKKEIALMRLIGVGMRKINLLYIIQNSIVGFISTVLAFGVSRICLIAMKEYISSMGIVLNAGVVYTFEWVIMAAVFIISIIPTVICTFSMSKKDGIEE
ncbi:MAG: ABC transporter permease [Clostridia bacterium]|nr:ABC transporter permease [Clostridia bacterium]